MSAPTPDIKGKPSPRWAFMQPFDIYAKDGSGDVYLHRLRLVQTPWFAVYVHDLNLPDSDRDPHDHPWTFWSVVLRGGYDEALWAVAPGSHLLFPEARAKRKRWHRFSVHRMTAGAAHMIESVLPRTKTLIITGPRHKGWGFYTEDGYVPWQEYVDVGEPS